MTHTDAPKTLLTYAGAPSAKLDLKHASLVMVDYQKEYTEGRLTLTGVEDAIVAAASILEIFRAAGAPVFHILHHARPGSPLFDPERSGADCIEMLSPAEGEVELIKALPNAFNGTGLEAELRATGRNQVVIAGFMTHMCVESTARSAAEMGFQVIVVDDACATRDLPCPNSPGDRMAAATLHSAALAALSDRFATIQSSADIYAAAVVASKSKELIA